MCTILLITEKGMKNELNNTEIILQTKVYDYQGSLHKDQY